jgi:serine/threonine-protein kinase HipA
VNPRQGQGDASRPRRLLSRGQRFHVSTDEAKQIIDKMERTVRERWRATLRRAGVSDADCEKLARAVAYEGFRLPLNDQAIQ